MEEIWLPIDGFDGYEVSNLGRIRSLDREVRNICRWGFEVSVLRKGKILTQYKVGGYLGLRFAHRSPNIYTHRIVASAFLPNPDCKRQVNHKNGDKHDNRVSNLEWVTQSENMLHSTHVLGNTAGQFRAKLTKWQP